MTSRGMENDSKIFKGLPSKPGIYKFYDSAGEVLYIGKAIDLKKRVKQHFERPHSSRIDQMVAQIAKVAVQETQSNIEALILESELVTSLKPKYNVKLQDDKTFLGVYITDEQFPRVFPARITNKKLPKGKLYGPFTSAKTLRLALKIIRKIFPYCANPPGGRPCLYYHLKQCPGPCAGAISATDYRRIIGDLKLFLSGKRVKLINQLKRDLRQLSKSQHYEQAALVRDSLHALQNIKDHSLAFSDAFNATYDASEHHPLQRIETYDVSDVSGKFAVGVMVVAILKGKDVTFQPSEYRTFNIKSVAGIDDVAMIRETVARRLSHPEWQFPELIILDGGKGHYGGVAPLIGQTGIKLIACAKGPTRKKTDLYFDETKLGDWLVMLPILRQSCGNLIAEAHRFAISRYRAAHRRALTK
ncbi:GIY-YIG nuclease family protein [Candidatus Berkelbacteria bacterium]|nr:GIY-YIG nuclease family protein [Candidatus Berkelbacteria bacterium]